MTSANYRLLLACRLLRSCAYGFMAVLLGLYLQRRGAAPAGVGLIITIGVLAGSLGSLPAAGLVRRWGRPRVLALTGALMAAAGLDLALAPPGAAWLAALTGMLGLGSADLGPFLALEQAMLAQAVAAGQRNRAFGRYSLSGGLAASLGSFAAAAGSSVGRTQLLCLVYAGLGLVTGGLALRLRDRQPDPGPRSLISAAHARPVAALAGLFAVDALGGGLVLPAVIAFWLHVRFHAGPEVLGPAFGVIGVVQAFSYELAGRLADRVGLVRTMVWTHVPSNVLLILVAFSVNLEMALVLLVFRFAIAQMDVPARQAYVASIVPSGERSGALAVTGAVRGCAQSIGPWLSGLAIQTAVLAAPFVVAGGLKLAYDLTLYALFRGRPAEHEGPSPRGGA